jgi:transcriptional regulator with XRE-family HTH domain
MADTVYLPSHSRAAIQGRMRQLGYSQQEMAKWLSVDQSRLSQKLNGKRDWSQEEIATIAGILEIEDLQREYPEELSETLRHRRKVQMAMQLVEQSFQEMPEHDFQEVLFALALILEGKRPYGEKAETKGLRGLSRLTACAV